LVYTDVSVTKTELEFVGGVTAGTKANTKALVTNSSGYLDKVTAVELQLMDTDASNTLSLFWNEDEVAADRILNLKVNGASPTLDLASGTNAFANDISVPQGNKIHLDNGQEWIYSTGTQLLFGVNNGAKFRIDAGFIDCWLDVGPRMIRTTATSTTTIFDVSGGTPGYGLGGAPASGYISLISNSVEGLRITESAGSITVDSYGDIVVPQGNVIDFDGGSGQEYIYGNGTVVYMASSGVVSLVVSNTETYGNVSMGGAILRQVPSATTPTLGFHSYNGFGLGGDPSSGYISLISNSVEGLRITESGGGSIPSYDSTAGITASTTQTQGQQPLVSRINEVSTVANTGDVVTLPSAVAGMVVTVINNGANTLGIFPASGDDNGSGVDTVTNLASGSNVTVAAIDTTTWEAI